MTSAQTATLVVALLGFVLVVLGAIMTRGGDERRRRGHAFLILGAAFAFAALMRSLGLAG